jgi:hypothetical protein
MIEQTQYAEYDTFLTHIQSVEIKSAKPEQS